jgi:hypothetical protein
MDNASTVQEPIATSRTGASPIESKSSLKTGVSLLIAFLVVLVLGLGGTVAYLLFLKGTDTDDTNSNDGGTVSQTCTYDGVTYDEGDSFEATDGCNTCSCADGEVTCTLMACETATVEPCTYTGVTYDEGEVIYTTGDGCNTCACHDNDIVCTNNICGDQSFENTYFSIDVPDEWTKGPVQSGVDEGVKLSKGNLDVYVLATDGSASGVVGGRISDVTKWIIPWQHDGANCGPNDEDTASGYIGTSTAIHTLTVSSTQPEYVYTACGLDSSRSYFVGDYVNNLGEDD